jgi:hypothetical protein
MHWMVLSKIDAVTEAVMKTQKGHRRTRDLLLQRLQAGNIEL